MGSSPDNSFVFLKNRIRKPFRRQSRVSLGLRQDLEVAPCLRRSGYAQAGLKLSQPAYPLPEHQAVLLRPFTAKKVFT
jgi:hypothetical protein